MPAATAATSFTKEELYVLSTALAHDFAHLYTQGEQVFYRDILPLEKRLYEESEQKALPDHLVEGLIQQYRKQVLQADGGWRMNWEKLGKVVKEIQDLRGKEAKQSARETGKEEGTSGEKGMDPERQPEVQADKARPKPVRITKGQCTEDAPPTTKSTTTATTKSRGRADVEGGATKKSKTGPKTPAILTDTDSNAQSAMTKGIFRDSRDMAEEKEREEREKEQQRKSKVTSKGKVTTAGVPVGGGLKSAESTGASGDAAAEAPSAPLEIARQHKVTKEEAQEHEAEAAKAEKTAARLIQVFGDCAPCQKANEKFNCDWCKLQKIKCVPGRGPGFQLDTPLGEYEADMYPPEQDGRIVRKTIDGSMEPEEDEEEPTSIKTAGTLFTTLVREQRILGRRLLDYRQEVKELATGVDTAPQHQEGITAAVQALNERLDNFTNAMTERDAKVTAVLDTLVKRLEVLEAADAKWIPKARSGCANTAGHKLGGDDDAIGDEDTDSQPDDDLLPPTKFSLAADDDSTMQVKLAKNEDQDGNSRDQAAGNLPRDSEGEEKGVEKEDGEENLMEQTKDEEESGEESELTEPDEEKEAKDEEEDKEEEEEDDKDEKECTPMPPPNEPAAPQPVSAPTRPKTRSGTKSTAQHTAATKAATSLPEPSRPITKRKAPTEPEVDQPIPTKKSKGNKK